MSIHSLNIYADGGSRNNPGEAAFGFVVYDNNNKCLVKVGKKIGITTNNIAEYSALLASLEWTKKHVNTPVFKITFYVDSLLVVQQLNGVYKIKSEKLREIVTQIKTLEKEITQNAIYKHIPREQNKEADFLVNQALDNLI